jgi:hypothetical protein
LRLEKPGNQSRSIDVTRLAAPDDGSFALFSNGGYARAAMNLAVEATAAAPASPAMPTLARVLEIRSGDSNLISVLTDTAEYLLARMVASNVRVSDEVFVADSTSSASANTEIYVRKPSIRGADIYHAKAGYAASPKLDRREESFVRVHIPGSQIGIEAIHVPCPAIRDYFFVADRTRSLVGQKNFYQLLHLPRDVTSRELRLGYRLRRMELQKENASKAELAALERAYNMLADPNIRVEYDALLRNGMTPVAFPYSGFGSLLMQGERSRDSGVFFANRILAFMPERRRRTVSVPLRKLDYFEDYAILRDRRRKIELLLDRELLPLRWDPTWNRWRHLISATVEVEGDFIRSGHYRKRNGEWKLIECETALPSRTEAAIPDNLEQEILKARTTHTRFGRYWKQIDRLREHVVAIPTERNELARICSGLGLPGDFDVAQITWRPDYDSYYYEHLSKRARTMYVFRDEYIFDLEKAVVAEVPQAGHATYLFRRPPDLTNWVWQYVKSTRREIRLNRDTVGECLGFLGRIVHGKDKAEWLRELTLRIGGRQERGGCSG